MKDRTALVLLLLLFAYGRSSTSSTSSTPAVPAPSPATPHDHWIEPGVYWWCAGASEAQALIEWFRVNVGMARLAKMLGSNGADCAIVLFEVMVPCVWTLSGVPEEAPFGLDTTLEDLQPVPSLGDFFRRKAAQTLEAIKAFDARIQHWLDSVLRPAPTH